MLEGDRSVRPVDSLWPEYSAGRAGWIDVRRLPDPLAARARSTPDRTAVVETATGTEWRYDELDDAVGTLAGRLAGLGLGPGDHLGLLADTSTDAVVLVHAAWRRGLRLVPLNVRLAETELSRQAHRSDLDALACVPETAGVAGAVVDCPVVSVDGVGPGPGDPGGPGGPGGGSQRGGDGATTDSSTESEADADHDPDSGETTSQAGVEPLGSIGHERADPATWRADDTALSLYTSGTTGEPKAVALTMGNLLASATASAFRLGVLPTDRWLLCLPIYHMGGLAPVVRTAAYGTTLVVQDGRDGFDAETVARATEAYGATGLSLVPTQLGRVLDADADLADSVRTVLLGGAPAPRELLERCERRDVPVHPTYGLTETASQVATATPEQAFAHPGTVGQPLLGTEVTVVDDDLEPVQAGESGEIVVSGPTVTPGYYDDPDATERALCEHGLRTGDVGRVDDAGRLWMTGRREDRIVTGGENVHPAEVEEVLRAHPAVADVSVVGLDDPDWGQRVAALVVPAGGDDTPRDDACGDDRPGEDADASLDAAADLDTDPEALLEFARERLAGFKVPKTLRVVDALPRTASGTVDREAARRTLEERAGRNGGA